MFSDFSNRCEEAIHEIGFWARDSISKGISDVDMDIDNPTMLIEGAIVVNKVGKIITMKGYLTGPATTIPNEASNMFMDFNLEWTTSLNSAGHEEGQIEYIQRQTAQKISEKQQRDMLRHRRQAKQGIMPMDYHQSMNRKTIIAKYYDDGGLVYE